MHFSYTNISFFLLFAFLFLFTNLSAQQSNALKVTLDSVFVKANKTQLNTSAFEIKINPNKNLQHHSLNTLLKQKATIFVKEYGKGQLASISVRGFGASQTALNWNGVKLNSPMNAQGDLNILQLGNSTRLVLSTENADNISGAINLEQTIRFKEKNALSFSATAGSFVSSAGNLSYVFSNQRWFFSTVFSYQGAKNNFVYKNPSLPANTNTKQVNAETKLLNFDQLLAYKLNSRNQIKCYVKYFRADRNLAPSLNETNATENQKDQLALGKIAWHHQYLKLETEINSALVYQDLDYKFSSTSGIDKSIAYSWQSNFSMKSTFSDYLDYKILLSKEFEAAQTVNYVDDVSRLKILFDNEISYSVQNFTSSLGFSEMLVQGKLSPFLPKAKLIFTLYDLPAKLLISADYKAKLRFPSLNELYWTPGGNENLIPETSHNIVLNLILARKMKHISFENKLEIYSIWANHFILWKPTQNSFWEPKNIGDVVSRGFSNHLNVAVNLKKDIQLDFNLDYHFNRISKVKSTKQLIYAPYAQLNLATNFTSKWIHFGFTHHFTSKSFANENNTIALKPYYLLGFNAHKVIRFKNKDELILGANLNNMTNQNYFSVINRPLPGFNFEFSLKYTLNFIKS